MKTLTAYTHKPASGAVPKQLVILLHGLGADGQDLLGLAPYFARNLPDVVFVAPDAPYRCDMSPMGYQWFSLQERTQEVRLQGVQQAAPIVNAFIKEQMEKYSIPAAKTALVGFSQGTMMSLYAGPRFPEKLAGIVGYSGMLVWEEDVDIASLQKIPVHLIHGDADGVLPVTAYHHAKGILEKAQFPLTGGVTPGLAHNIDEAGLQEGAAFLARVLA